MNLGTMFRKEMIEQWRTSRLMVVVVVLVFFGLFSPVAAKYTPELFKSISGLEQYADLIPKPTILDAVAQYVKNVGQFFPQLLAVVLAMSMVSGEKERGSAALMLVKPLPRASFLFAKFLALASSFTIGMLLAGLGAYLYTLYLFGPLDVGAWLALNGLMLLDKWVYIAVTLLASTLFRSQAAAAGMGIGVWLLFIILGAFPRVAELLPNQMMVWGGSLFNAQPVTGWPAVAVAAALMIASLAAAWLVFERQEL